MFGFTLTTQTQAPVEEVWKLLFDPTRFPEWWAGVETVRVEQPGVYTMWPDGYPDFPMPQLLRTDRAAGRITISCQVSDIDVTWQLADTAAGTAITVRVELPEAESHRLDGQRDLITASLAKLSELAQGPAQ
ncbi:MAG: SRPBCC family protein, partial [Pseudonocardia sp.]|nr:SRPBCC family protein [Pseudonocardia sp.]